MTKLKQPWKMGEMRNVKNFTLIYVISIKKLLHYNKPYYDSMYNFQRQITFVKVKTLSLQAKSVFRFLASAMQFEITLDNFFGIKNHYT